MHIDLTDAPWRKSTHSGGQNGCVEVADGFTDTVPVRDSKNPTGPALVFTADAWQAFVTATAAGEFGTA
ncbi:DUF397 domain-containing protein [Kitasatospora sp. NPDC057015]|uniref:DUF397 domain-containing protein n=1 Tax=Kitasatospora sp. NPDC057015 TaxID=3346001 RepID=UPI00362971A5